MRKVILNVAISLDGFIEGPNGEYDWCFVDQDYGMSAFFGATDAVFMGRKSYDLIASTGDFSAFPEFKKYIFTDSLDEVKFPGATIIRSENFIEDVKAIKEQPGGNIWLFGGASLVESFIKNNLLDEYLLSIHPIVLGAGKPLFTNIDHRLALMHIDTKTYDTGLVQLRYIPRPQFGQVPGYDI